VKRLVEFISPWALVGIGVWIVVMATVVNLVKESSRGNVGDGPCADPCVFVPPPINWLPVLALAIAVALIVTAVLAAAVILVRQARRR